MTFSEGLVEAVASFLWVCEEAHLSERPARLAACAHPDLLTMLSRPQSSTIHSEDREVVGMEVPRFGPGMSELGGSVRRRLPAQASGTSGSPAHTAVQGQSRALDNGPDPSPGEDPRPQSSAPSGATVGKEAVGAGTHCPRPSKAGRPSPALAEVSR